MIKIVKLVVFDREPFEKAIEQYGVVSVFSRVTGVSPQDKYYHYFGIKQGIWIVFSALGKNNVILQYWIRVKPEEKDEVLKREIKHFREQGLRVYRGFVGE